jgi:hypothetical protein
MHYDDAALRRSIDEPESVDPALAAHMESCEPCRARRAEFAENAAFAGRIFGERAPAPDVSAAFERVAAGAVRTPAPPAWAFSAAGLCTAACLVLALVFTPLGGLATQLLTIFEPRQFVPIEISARDSEQLRLAPNLGKFGTFSTPARQPERKVSSLAGLGRTLGFEPRRFDYVAPGTHPAHATFVQMQSSTSFTFSAAKTRAYEARFGRSLPPMPAGLDGTTFRATYGPTIARVYGQDPARLRDATRDKLDGVVFFIESKAPSISSTGASLEVAANYMLSMPNVPADVVAQLRAIGDPSHTLPIPLDFDRTSAKAVSVNGLQGLAIGDETGLGTIVVWQQGGVVYVVAGALRESEALALADGVK